MKKALFAIISIFCWQTSNGQLVINELMQSNVDCIMDDLNDFPDSWVELYNAGSTGVDLSNYRLGLSDKAEEAWHLPSVMVGSKQYVLIYCDKEAQSLHTNFRLESGKGGAVYLFEGSTVADKVTDMAKQPSPNIAYGRKTDGSSEWGYQLEPTPNAANCGATSSQLLGDPVFSEQGRVITGGSFTLKLSVPEGSPAGTEIRITTDGSEPTAQSTLYTDPISLNSTLTVRARLFCAGWLSPRSVTQSYIFFSRNQTLPLISIVTDKRYLSDPKIGIYVDGSYESGKKNYEHNWRRPMNIEYFETSGQPSEINQLCEARIAGGATRGAALKTLAVYANKRFGKKHLEYEFFPDQKPGLREFKSVMLRNSGNDFDYLYMRDPIVQRTMASRRDLDWQAWRPAIIYINGQYKGMLNIRERSNEDNIWSNYDKLEDIDMIENWKELKEGTWDNYNLLMAFCNAHNHTMAEYDKLIDCSEYADLMLMHLYFNNVDTPGNNWMMWRPRAEGGRWRFVAKDCDYTMGLYGDPVTYKIINWLYNPNYDYGKNWGANRYEATRIFRRLMEDTDFFNMFIDRACIYMGDFLNERGIREVWDPMYNMVRSELDSHRKLYQVNQWWPPSYSDEVSKARNWITQRTKIFYNQLGDYYKLGTGVRMSVNKTVDNPEEMEITFNGYRLTKGSFDGQFFADREVTLEAKAPEGKVVKGWSVVNVSSSGAVSTQVEGSTYSFLMPECSSLNINVILADADDPSGISTITEQEWGWHKDGNLLILYGVPAGTKVQLYDLRGMLLNTVVASGEEIILPLKTNALHVLKVGSKVVKL
ncbi:MAG: CotH kinase family protein [Prevotella sp.]|nr:CotH kinase family protein [Prevotella sp.]